MSRAVKLTLLVIAAFVAIMLGSFIWFVATWDSSAEEPVTQRVPSFLETEKGVT